MTDTAQIHALLLARLAELHERRDHIAADLAVPLSADFAEQASEAEDDEALIGQEALIAQEMAAIEAALGRIDDGSYGTCARCGEPVGAARLAAQPEAALCIACASG